MKVIIYVESARETAPLKKVPTKIKEMQGMLKIL
jgi:hypothetical protein